LAGSTSPGLPPAGDAFCRVGCLLIPPDPIIDVGLMSVVIAQSRLDRADRLFEPVCRALNVSVR
jgi:hypothetical protein